MMAKAALMNQKADPDTDAEGAFQAALSGSQVKAPGSAGGLKIPKGTLTASETSLT